MKEVNGIKILNVDFFKILFTIVETTILYDVLELRNNFGYFTHDRPYNFKWFTEEVVLEIFNIYE